MDLIVKYRKLVCEAVDGGNEVDVPAICWHFVPKYNCTSEKVGHESQDSSVLKTRPGYSGFSSVGKRCDSVTCDWYSYDSKSSINHIGVYIAKLRFSCNMFGGTKVSQ